MLPLLSCISKSPFLTSIICVFMIIYFIPEFVVVFQLTCVCPYKSNFQMTLPFSPAQAHRGTLCGLLCDQFSSQPHPLFPILTEWEFLKQPVRLHSLNLWNILFIWDDDLVFYDRDQFKRVFQSLLITPFSRDKKWMRPRQVQRNLPTPPSSQNILFYVYVY